MKITVYPPDRQGTGAFDGGKITEIKPIDFPGGSSQSRRLGPLFYWAWATSRGEGVIGMHPHQGFEIMSYVLVGEIGHTDTLGTKSRVATGGAQVMLTGSGVSHQEEIYGRHTEFFQIWFEPDLQEAVDREPSYSEHHNGDFPVIAANGVRRKLVIGGQAPVSLVADIQMEDVTIEPGATYRRQLAAGRCLTAVAVEGTGSWQIDTAAAENAAAGAHSNPVEIQKPDFSVLEPDEAATVAATAAVDEALRLALVEVPLSVDYRLYGE